MGFRQEKAPGLSISLKAAKAHGAPSAVNVDALLSMKPTDRTKWLQENADISLTPVMSEAVKKAESIDDLLVALEKRIARGVNPHPVPRGAMILQPSEEHRRSASHYTPGAPIPDRPGPHPSPEHILALKVCRYRGRLRSLPRRNLSAARRNACNRLASSRLHAAAS
jgi:hypothetical protein